MLHQVLSCLYTRGHYLTSATALEKGKKALKCKVLSQTLLFNEGDRERTEIFQQCMLAMEAATPKHSTKFVVWYRQASPMGHSFP